MEQSATGSNKLGTWAFVFSLTGVSCLPFLGSIVGLVTGIIAVRREPRGLAIAAIVISTVGGCLVPVVAAPFVLLFPALAKARSTTMRMRVGIDVGTMVDSYHTKKGRMPVDLAEVYGGEGYVPLDEWGTAMRLAIDPAPSDGNNGAGSGGANPLFVNYRIIGAGKDIMHQGLVFRNEHGEGLAGEGLDGEGLDGEGLDGEGLDGEGLDGEDSDDAMDGGDNTEGVGSPSEGAPR